MVQITCSTQRACKVEVDSICLMTASISSILNPSDIADGEFVPNFQSVDDYLAELQELSAEELQERQSYYDNYLIMSSLGSGEIHDLVQVSAEFKSVGDKSDVYIDPNTEVNVKVGDGGEILGFYLYGLPEDQLSFISGNFNGRVTCHLNNVASFKDGDSSDWANDLFQTNSLLLKKLVENGQKVCVVRRENDSRTPIPVYLSE